MVDRRHRVLIWLAGLFTVVHFPAEDITILWDRKTTIHIQVGPVWQVSASAFPPKPETNCKEIFEISVSSLTRQAVMVMGSGTTEWAVWEL